MVQQYSIVKTEHTERKEKLAYVLVILLRKKTI